LGIHFTLNFHFSNLTGSLANLLTYKLFSMSQHYLTRDGLEKLKKDLELLKSVTRKEVVDRIASARELGDLKENAEYAEAKDDQAMLEGKILEMEALVREAVIIEEGSNFGETTTVTLGSTVTISNGGTKQTFTIVGAEEADPGAGKISHESPIGRILLGKKQGDKVLAKVPKGEFEYKIEEIL